VTATLASAGLPVVVTHPRQVRDFAKACGRLAKTDALDARTLARFAAQVRPAPRLLPTEAAQLLDALLTRRRQLVAARYVLCSVCSSLQAKTNALTHSWGGDRAMSQARHPTRSALALGRARNS
jgi:transposase